MTLSEPINSGDGTRPEDTFKILLATDIHLGYNETDKVTGKFKRMAEISQFYFILLNADFQEKIHLTPSRRF